MSSFSPITVKDVVPEKFRALETAINESLMNPRNGKFARALNGGAGTGYSINIAALAMPFGKQLLFNYMSGPAKLFTLTSVAILILEVLIRSWAIYSLNATGNYSLADNTWFWVSTVLSILAAVIFILVSVIIINTLNYAGHGFMSWMWGLLPIFTLLGLLFITPQFVDVITEMVSGKDLASALADVFPNLHARLTKTMQKA